MAVVAVHVPLSPAPAGGALPRRVVQRRRPPQHFRAGASSACAGPSLPLVAAMPRAPDEAVIWPRHSVPRSIVDGVLLVRGFTEHTVNALLTALLTLSADRATSSATWIVDSAVVGRMLGGESGERQTGSCAPSVGQWAADPWHPFCANFHKFLRRDIFDQSHILLPVVMEDHWFLLVVVNPPALLPVLHRAVAESTHDSGREAAWTPPPTSPPVPDAPCHFLVFNSFRSLWDHESYVIAVVRSCILDMFRVQKAVAAGARQHLVETLVSGTPVHRITVGPQTHGHLCGVFLLAAADAYLRESDVGRSRLWLERWGPDQEEQYWVGPTSGDLWQRFLRSWRNGTLDWDESVAKSRVG